MPRNNLAIIFLISVLVIGLAGYPISLQSAVVFADDDDKGPNNDKGPKNDKEKGPKNDKGSSDIARSFEDDENEIEDEDEREVKDDDGEEGEEEVEIEAEVEDGVATVEVEIGDEEFEFEFILISTNPDDVREEIENEIMARTDLTKDQLVFLEIEFEDEEFELDDGDHGKKDKITICHIPPGNPDNAHTISVSGNAKNAHLAHGDTMGECPDGDDDGQDNTTTITLTKQVTNDNQGTAGPDDFKISVNGTIVLSGSTTEVAPDVFFAINETVADGYAFVEITGDPECPTNLDEKTISLASGQDINCTIHNNDAGQASSSSFQTSESTSEVDATSDNDDLSQLIEENKKLREDLESQGEQIDDLNEQVDYLSEIIASIQGFFGSIFG